MSTISGPALRGSNIDLDMILAKTDGTKRRTKIFCTLGPACWDVPMLETLIHEGLNVARFNFSHGDHEGHKACLDRLRQACANTGKEVGTYPFAFVRRRRVRRKKLQTNERKTVALPLCVSLIVFWKGVIPSRRGGGP